MSRAMKTAQKSIALISPYAASVVPFRGRLIRSLLDDGVKVFVLAPDYTTVTRNSIAALGADTIEYTLNRTGINPFDDVSTLKSLALFLRKSKPDVVLTYQTKPNIYGTMAAKLSGVRKSYALIEGLGFAFTQGESNIKKRVLEMILKRLYKYSLSYAENVFFLNPDDLSDFVNMGLVVRSKAVLLGGIGVDLDKWPPGDPVLQPLTFTLVGRLLKEKGVLEFIEAAKRVKLLHQKVKFLLIGPLDTNPGSVDRAYVLRWVDEGVIEWIPWTDDVRSYIGRTSVFVLPSYREGVPRSTQEAMAMAKPIITTDVPGCRETVVNGVNGFLVPPRDAKALAAAMVKFINEPQQIERMGRESRRLAEERFDEIKFNKKLIAHISKPWRAR